MFLKFILRTVLVSEYYFTFSEIQFVNLKFIRGDDWKALAVTLGVNYKTAYTWIRSGIIEGSKRGGGKP